MSTEAVPDKSEESTDSPPKTWKRYQPSLQHLKPYRHSNAEGCNRIDQAGLLSFATYSWVFKYMWQAFNGILSDTWKCSMFDGVDANVRRLEVLWKQELKARPIAPRLWIVIYHFISTRLWTACGLFAFCLCFGFIGPTCFIRGLIAFAEAPLADGEADLNHGIILSLSILFIELARVITYGATWAISYRTGTRVRSAVLGFLYQKLLNSKGLSRTNGAEIINMFANDGQRIFDAITFLPLVLIGPFVLIGGIVYLVVIIGWWSLAGIMVFFIFDIIQYKLGMTMVNCRKNAIQRTEDRMSLMGEIVKYIRIIKMNTLERNVTEKIEKIRHEEKVQLRTAGYAQSMAIACGPVVPVVAAVITFTGIVLSGNDLLASDAFSAITVFFVMLFGIRMIPYGSRYLAECIVALRRISVVLQCEQWHDVETDNLNPATALKLTNASFSWAPKIIDESKSERNDKDLESSTLIGENSNSTFTLQDLTLTIPKGQLVGICGEIGSGKSALLASITGHTNCVNGLLELQGSIAYVPQTAWIQNGTFKDNILFGATYIDAERLNNVQTVCQLNKDFELIKDGLRAMIGERGTTLSGGQKARVALARALYANRDIYLIDDVLTAVDRNVSNMIFRDAIKETLKKKTVLFVTSDIERLSECDSVIFLHDGKIVAHGAHDELRETCDTYNTFCRLQQCKIPLVNPEMQTAMEHENTPVILLDEEGEPTRGKKSYSFVHKDQKEQNSLLTDEENLGLSQISWTVYRQYMRSAGSIFLWTVIFFAFILNIASTIFSTYWLSFWLKNGHGEYMEIVNGTSQLRSSLSLANSADTWFYTSVYGFLMVLLLLSGLFKAWVVVKATLNAATQLHNRMFGSLIKGRTLFFDTNPSGRILNRFSKDMDEIDVKLPFSLEVFLQNMLTCVGYILVIIWVFPYFLIAAIAIFLVFVVFVACFRAGIRSLKRSENISRSPLYDHINASLEGIPVIHSFGQSERFLRDLKEYMDLNSGSMFMFQSAMRWLAVWLDLLVVVITFAVAICIVFLSGKVSPADAGMALAFAIQMSGIFQFAVRTQTELDAKMTSVERVVDYAENIAPESSWDTQNINTLPSSWPTKGEIEFKNVKLRYRPNMEMSLCDASFKINSKEKIGVIGRTGSGKTSIANVLYRLYDVSEGKILIDDVDICSIGLHTLRQSISIIPQDPVLFIGTIKSNIDPNSIHTDEQIWNALEKTHMRTIINGLTEGLFTPVKSGGENFSQGQRQLLCMARALLQNSKIVVMDEATASLDGATDKLIHACLRENLKDRTVIIIAHKLSGIVDCDRVMIMNEGKIVAFDSPDNLLQNDQIDFNQIVSDREINQHSHAHEEHDNKSQSDEDSTEHVDLKNSSASYHRSNEENASNLSVKSLHLDAQHVDDQKRDESGSDAEILEDDTEHRVVALDDIATASSSQNSSEDNDLVHLG